MTGRVPLSVVVPCYNEEAVLPSLHVRITAACRRVGGAYEIVLVNDGSDDRTWSMMTDLAAEDPHLVCVDLSRNHGHQLALSAGLAESCGDVVLTLDADLQDPPELLPDMLALMRREGADVVYGSRTKRDGDSWAKRAASHLFYRGLQKLADTPVPVDAGDFRLMSRRVVDAVAAMPERQRYVRGMVSWMGFKQIPFEYHRRPRAAGVSKYTFGKLVGLAFDGLTGCSVSVLRLPMRFGVACLASAAVTTCLAVSSWLAGGGVPTGGLLAGLVLGLLGIQFLFLGILGSYVGRIHADVRGRPMFVVDTVIRGADAAAAGRREAA